jgi:hypothetical protein
MKNPPSKANVDTFLKYYPKKLLICKIEGKFQLQKRLGDWNWNSVI